MGRRIPGRLPVHGEPAPFAVSARVRPEQPYQVGARVFHQKFGYGTVSHVDNDKLEIEFDSTGMKKVMDSFVVAAETAG